MKKIIFAVGFFSFSLASAQENDFFDIQKHLEKKNKKNSTIPLKRPQIKTPDKKDLTISLLFTDKQATLSHILSNGNKVYLLPQSNMPCIFPEMLQFNMPVIVYNAIPGTMPNLWRNRFKIIPD